MEFEMKYKIATGQEIVVLVDAAGEECLISLTFPFSYGDDLRGVIASAWLELTKIEESAWQSYQCRLEEVNCEKN